MILTKRISLEELKAMDNGYYADRIKFCVDIKRNKVAVNEEIHNDMEIELYDDGSNDKDIFGGDIILKPEISILWEAHPNIARNRELHIGQGRLLSNEEYRQKCFDVLSNWIC